MIRDGLIDQRVVFAADRQELFACFTDPERLAGWLGEADVDASPGGPFSVALPGGQFWDGVVVEIQPPHRFVVTLGWRDGTDGLSAGMSLVEWDFALDAKGSRLRLHHSLVPPELLDRFNELWARLFARLRNVLEGRPPGPHPLAAIGGPASG